MPDPKKKGPKIFARGTPYEQAALISEERTVEKKRNALKSGVRAGAYSGWFWACDVRSTNNQKNHSVRRKNEGWNGGALEHFKRRTARKKKKKKKKEKEKKKKKKKTYETKKMSDRGGPCSRFFVRKKIRNNNKKERWQKLREFRFGKQILGISQNAEAE